MADATQAIAAMDTAITQSRALVITTSLSVLRRHVLKSASMVLISTIGLTIWYRMEPVKGLFARSPAAADRVSEICPLLPAPFVPSLAASADRQRATTIEAADRPRAARRNRPPSPRACRRRSNPRLAPAPMFAPALHGSPHARRCRAVSPPRVHCQIPRWRASKRPVPPDCTRRAGEPCRKRRALLRALRDLLGREVRVAAAYHGHAPQSRLGVRPPCPRKPHRFPVWKPWLASQSRACWRPHSLSP